MPKSPEPCEPAGKPRPRRRLQFSLRAAFALLTLLGLALGVWTSSARRQRQAVEELESLGVGVDFSYETNPADLWVPDWIRDRVGLDMFTTVSGVRIDTFHIDGVQQYFAPTPLVREQMDKAIAILVRFPRLKSLRLDRTGIGDDDLARLAPLADRIESFVLSDWPHNPKYRITGEGLRHLVGWRRLTDLSLDLSRIEADAIEYLDQLPALEHLHLSINSIGSYSEATFEACGRISGLKTLSLHGGRFNGRWLAHLREAKQLETVYLTNYETEYVGPRVRATGGSPATPVESEESYYRYRRTTKLPPLSSTLNANGSNQAAAGAPSSPSVSNSPYHAWLERTLPGVSVKVSERRITFGM